MKEIMSITDRNISVKPSAILGFRNFFVGVVLFFIKRISRKFNNKLYKNE